MNSSAFRWLIVLPIIFLSIFFLVEGIQEENDMRIFSSGLLLLPVFIYIRLWLHSQDHESPLKTLEDMPVDSDEFHQTAISQLKIIRTGELLCPFFISLYVIAMTSDNTSIILKVMSLVVILFCIWPLKRAYGFARNLRTAIELMETLPPGERVEELFRLADSVRHEEAARIILSRRDSTGGADDEE